MNKSIVRTEEEIKAHLTKLQDLSDSKTPQVAENNLALYSLLNGYLSSDDDPNEVIGNLMPKYSTLNLLSKLIVDTCLWLTGKFYSAPTYLPLEESQFSTEQVLEDFGRTNYTTFNIN